MCDLSVLWISMHCALKRIISAIRIIYDMYWKNLVLSTISFVQWKKNDIIMWELQNMRWLIEKNRIEHWNDRKGATLPE